MLVAAGDDYAWGLGTSQEEGIAADCQGVLTIGGTTLTVTSTGRYVGEVGWNATAAEAVMLRHRRSLPIRAR